jgi:serine/threonine protein kinase/predicted ATPase
MGRPLLYGKYQLLEQIASGGMAEVYKAKSHGVEGFEKLVVIKRILPELSRNERFVEMFIDEAKISVTLNHANVVQVFDLGRSEGSYFIAMEYVHGVDLACILREFRQRGQVFSVALAIYLVSEVAKGLDYAHRRKDQNMEPLSIVHRDLSPHNIMVSFEGEVKITDFGIARAKGAVGLGAEAVEGKLPYMSPEQARGEAVDHRADIYSLGVVLYETLTGEPPWRQGTDQEVLEQVSAGDFRPLSEVAPSLPQDLKDIVERAMARDLEARYPNAGRMYEELVSFLYTTKQRVDAHEVAQLLEKMGITSLDRPKPPDADKSLRECFGADTTPTPRTPRQGERTPVEVPTATPEPSTTLRECLGAKRLPSEMREVTALALEIFGGTLTEAQTDELRELIERDGGSVVETRTEFIVALFGLGQGDGRDTESAVACGLKLQRLSHTLTGPDEQHLVLGVGIHPERIVAIAEDVPIPREDHRYYAIIDAARTLAGRRTGAVLVSRQARAVVRDLFAFRPLGSGIWAVTGERPIGEVYGSFIGRTEALRRIGELLAYCNRGAPAVLRLIGDAGTGKTRLLHETHQRLASGGHEFNWYQVRAAPQPSDVPFASLAQMIRPMVGLDETDPPERVRERVERLRQLGLGQDEVDVVAQLLGAPRPPAEDRASLTDRQIPMAFVRTVSKLAEDRLTVLGWDAAERMDNASIEAVRALVLGAERARVLVILSARSSAAPRLVNLGQPEVLLGPLSDEEAITLAKSRLKASKLPQALVEEIASKTGGNPLFIEEHLKAMLASGALRVRNGRVKYRPEAAEVEVPRSLRGLLLARVERLEPGVRGFLQRAAVLTHQFSADILAAVAGTTLGESRAAIEELQREGILEQVGREEYGFASDMLREVVYDGITYSDRRDIHRKVASEIEGSSEGKLDDVAERLAIHYRESGQREKAIEFLVRAGDKLAGEDASAASLRHYLRAVELLQNMPGPNSDRVLALYQQVGEMALASGKVDVGREKMRLALELAEEVENKESTVALLTLTGRICEKATKYGEAHRYFQRALELIGDMNDAKFRAGVLGSIGETLSHNGEYKQATDYLEEALELARAAGDKRHETAYLRELASCWAARGQGERALECIESAERAAEALEDHLLRCEVWKSRGLVSYMVRDDQGAMAAFSKAMELGKEYGFPYEVAAAAHNLGDLQIRTGDYRAAFTALRQSYEISRQQGFTKLEALNMMLLGYIDAVNFRSEEGLVKIERAREFAETNGYTWDVIQATYFLGKACLDLGQTERGRTALRDAIRLGHATENRLYVEDCKRLLAEVE